MCNVREMYRGQIIQRERNLRRQTFQVRGMNSGLTLHVREMYRDWTILNVREMYCRLLQV